MNRFEFDRTVIPGRVSVCIPTYNGGEYFELALACLAKQTWDDLEIIIVDDGSTDGTVATAEAFARKDPRVVVHRNAARLGAPGNCRRAAEYSSGEWIKFFFQDDLLAPECIEAMATAGERTGRPFVACRREILVDGDIPIALAQWFSAATTRFTVPQLFPTAGDVIDAPLFSAQIARLPLVNFIGEPTVVLLHRRLITQYGWLDPDMPQLADWDYWIRVCANEGLCFVDRELATFRVHDRGTTVRNHERAQFAAYFVDPMIVLWHIMDSADCLPIRQCAHAAGEWDDLIETFSDHFMACQAELARLTADGGAAGADAAMQWRALLQRFPMLPRNHALLHTMMRVRRRIRRIVG